MKPVTDVRFPERDARQIRLQILSIATDDRLSKLAALRPKPVRSSLREPPLHTFSSDILMRLMLKRRKVTIETVTTS